ncbi:MAG: catechol 2,3-dioxygenase [Spongiibacteraceae bacterium]
MAMTGILRPGHICLRVMDLAMARAHYTERVGLIETGADEGRVFLKGWDEHDAYSVILMQSDRAGMAFYGFKVRADSDLDHYQSRLHAAGVETIELPPAELPRCGRRLRFSLPTGQLIELYAEKELAGTARDVINPDPWPDGLKGMAVRRLDHIAIYGEEFDATVKIFTDVLDFSVTEQIVDGDMQIAAFMSCSTKAHDIAIVRQPLRDKLHHVSFLVGSWEEVLKAADIVAKHDIPMALTPTRHGVTRGKTCYFYDPSGNCNEAFSEDSCYYPDYPILTWTADKAGKALLFHHAEIDEAFMGACT